MRDVRQGIALLAYRSFPTSHDVGDVSLPTMGTASYSLGPAAPYESYVQHDSDRMFGFSISYIGVAINGLQVQHCTSRPIIRQPYRLPWCRVLPSL